MTEIIGRALSFDDVLVVQQVSPVKSRYDSRMNLATKVANNAPEINTPFVSANMDTVTESQMAIAMALLGGLGVIHRLMPADKQAEEVRIVKSQMAIIENNPITISEQASVADALKLLERYKRGYVIIVPVDGKPGEFLGMATNRDFKAGEQDEPITRIMTAKQNLFSVPQGTTREQAVIFMKKKRVEKVPVIRDDGTLVGIFTLKDDEMLDKYPHASKDNLGRLLVAAAIGLKPQYLEKGQKNDIKRAHQLEDAGVDFLVLDVAHGGMEDVPKMINLLKGHEGIKTPIIAGNVSTKETTLHIINSGADGVKVGVGPGLVCDTRDVAGVGFPQISAIISAREAMSQTQSPIPIIADGGIRKPGDVTKAIGAGADSVMIGSIIAGTTESPGKPVNIDGVLHKMVRGMSSEEANEIGQQIEGEISQRKRVPEGNTKFVPVQGSVEDIIFYLDGGFRSGMSYTGAFTIPEMHEKTKLIEITSAGANEQRRPLK